MNSKIFMKRVATLAIVVALFAPLLVRPSVAQAEPKIIFDYSHGQASSPFTVDEWLMGNLTALGYEIVVTYGGLNDTILSDADGLVIGSIYGADSGFLAAEVTAMVDWFNAGNKFLWVAADSDYGSDNSGQWINDNMTLILDGVGSHIHFEPTAIQDPVSNCGAGYRPVANGTSSDAYVADIVADTTNVLMHGPTLLYGSTDGVSTSGEVALETTSIPNVYPLLYYGGNATIVDDDLIEPVAHDVGDVGEFVACAMETFAGEAGTGVLIASGASPYADYRPMCQDEYYGVTLDGYNFVEQAIHFGMSLAPTLAPPMDMTMLLIAGGIGAVVIVIIIVVLMKRK
jgi:hypothetical protein